MWPGWMQPMLLPEESRIFMLSFSSVAPRVFLAKIPYLAFSHYRGNYFMIVLLYVLSWVKTYLYAMFQRNPPTGLARIMVQTYRQTHRRTHRQTHRQTHTDRQTDKYASPFIYLEDISTYVMQMIYYIAYH